MRLVEQLNGVLVTRDTPRGLVVTVSDSSFSGSELRAGVASRIGRLAAILAPYPDLRIVVEGSSDSASNDSQATRRAESVRQALVANGMPARSGCGPRAGRLASAGFQLQCLGPRTESAGGNRDLRRLDRHAAFLGSHLQFDDTADLEEAVMKYVGAVILCAMAAAATAQSKSDAADVREAIRFERAKDAAAKRQVRRAPAR